VLRGPQGTLYGAASLAGAIKIVTRKPDFERFDGHVMASVSDTEFGGGNFDVEAMMNIPVSDRLALRVSAYREENDGYIDIHEIDLFANPTGDLVKKDANGETVTGGRLALSLLATDSLTIAASVMHDNTKQDATNYLHPRSPGDARTGSSPSRNARISSAICRPSNVLSPGLLNCTPAAYSAKARTDRAMCFGVRATMRRR